MDNKSFEEQIRIENKSNNDKWEWDRHCAANRGEDIYTAFCLWCNCQGDMDNKLRSNSQVFANWLKRHNITLTDYQRRCIAENHFGWKFTWNSDLNKWEEKKYKYFEKVVDKHIFKIYNKSVNKKCKLR